MAGLQFRYDGEKRLPRRREMCFFQPRYSIQNGCYCTPQRNEPELVKKPEEVNQQDGGFSQGEVTPLEVVTPLEEVTPQETVLPKEEIASPETVSSREEVPPREEDSPREEIIPQETAFPDVTTSSEKNGYISLEETKNKLHFSQISELLIQELTATEVNLSEIKNIVDNIKPYLDDFIFKLESFRQIVNIVKANENRRLNGPQAQVTSLKTTKDSVDEILELLQGPVFQNVLRQFLVSMLMRDI